MIEVALVGWMIGCAAAWLVWSWPGRKQSDRPSVLKNYVEHLFGDNKE